MNPVRNVLVGWPEDWCGPITTVLLWTTDGSGAPHPDWRRAVVAGMPGMRKVHGEHRTDRGRPLAVAGRWVTKGVDGP
jgi:hypothetical protein